MFYILVAIIMMWVVEETAYWTVNRSTRNNFAMVDPITKAEFRGSALNTLPDGSLRSKIILFHFGFVTTPALPIVMLSLKVLRKFFHAWSDYSIVGISVPGFGGTTDLHDLYSDEELNTMGLEAFTVLEARTLEAQGVERIIAMGISMGANSVGNLAAMVRSSFSSMDIEAVVLIEGLFEKMSMAELKKRFAGKPVDATVKRLQLKFWRPKRKLSVRLANRGTIRMLLMEIIPMMSTPKRRKSIELYNRMLAETTLLEDVQYLHEDGVHVMVLRAGNSRMTNDEVYENPVFIPGWIKDLPGTNGMEPELLGGVPLVTFSDDNHLGLTNDPYRFGESALYFASNMARTG